MKVFYTLNIPKNWQITKAKRKHIKENNSCAICGYKKKLEAHHIIPVHVDISLSCDDKNLITLCRSCHFTFGHFHNFRKYWNPDIQKYAKLINGFFISYKNTFFNN